MSKLTKQMIENNVVPKGDYYTIDLQTRDLCSIRNLD